MSKRADKECLNDIKEACRRIQSYIRRGNYERFLKDIKTQDAVVRNLEIIGEAVKNISGAFKKENSRIPWKELAGTRDRLILHYFGVNFDIVWTIAKQELPKLATRIEKISKRYTK